MRNYLNKGNPAKIFKYYHTAITLYIPSFKILCKNFNMNIENKILMKRLTLSYKFLIRRVVCHFYDIDTLFWIGKSLSVYIVASLFYLICLIFHILDLRSRFVECHYSFWGLQLHCIVIKLKYLKMSSELVSNHNMKPVVFCNKVVENFIAIFYFKIFFFYSFNLFIHLICPSIFNIT